jgi:hypothetical protein
MNIENVIASMMTENTGTHMLDSGGAYGRNWQRNKGLTADILKEMPSATLEVSIREYSGRPHADLCPTVNIFHKLTSGILELDERCETFNAMPVPDWGDQLSGVSDRGAKWLIKNDFSWDDQSGFNTYNWAANLSQTLAGSFISQIDDGNYVLLQIHGGADVRGGYTDAKLFKLNDWCEEHDVYIDDCDFSVECHPGEYISVSWSGEWINNDGGTLTDDEALEFANCAGCVIDGPDVIINGDCRTGF